jgi:hypothetical protein
VPKKTERQGKGRRGEGEKAFSIFHFPFFIFHFLFKRAIQMANGKWQMERENIKLEDPSA